ncbi:MAG: hypothetical protein ACLSXM_09675 [Turicibacter sanguinis]|uniref:Uncharacterized protein n=2 Tax=Turicibacter sanguinis TaxID=154288 RepID=A0A9X4XH52_9FIRM|nr:MULTISPECIES: hypothetical protein [Turicibacter]EFF62915.1 hypothetical protein CUW_0107 [Turicibacter sanguinis PC909]EGC92840.1 hypothetical protein HMPREF9402_1403 [Turicibacter sp. HGF1]MBP3903728.1 hypothetical protein [Turicibacter sp.]MCU7190108.1 hypothetical protein [Turicibacter sanguinis]MCU7196003.1 hypothetical protein [Turicibacter sanguinis]
MDWLQLLLFGFILLYLLMKVIQTKSLKTTMILITGVLVIGCKLFLQQLDSMLLRQLLASLTFILCLISGWLIIKRPQ